MVTARYPTSRTGSGRQGLHILEGVFALSVIAGLTFVTVRVFNMPESSTQAAASISDLGKTEASSPAPDAPATKTP